MLLRCLLGAWKRQRPTLNARIATEDSRRRNLKDLRSRHARMEILCKAKTPDDYIPWESLKNSQKAYRMHW